MTNGRNLNDIWNIAEKAGFVYQNLLCWRKNNCTPNKYYMNQAEFILMLSKRPARNINNMGSSNILDFPNIKNKEHPTQKNVDMLKILV
jgi:site-specific DNA-methyltransferase (adenine-specific)